LPHPRGGEDGDAGPRRPDGYGGHFAPRTVPILPARVAPRVYFFSAGFSSFFTSFFSFGSFLSSSSNNFLASSRYTNGPFCSRTVLRILYASSSFPRTVKSRAR